jgi:hypothetical protein
MKLSGNLRDTKKKCMKLSEQLSFSRRRHQPNLYSNIEEICNMSKRPMYRGYKKVKRGVCQTTPEPPQKAEASWERSSTAAGSIGKGMDQGR